MIAPREIDDPGSLLGDDLRALRAAPAHNVDFQAGLVRLSAAIGAPMPPGLEQGHVPGTGAAGGSPVGAGGMAAALAGKKLLILVVTTVAVAGGAATGWIGRRPARTAIDTPSAQLQPRSPTVMPLGAPIPELAAPPAATVEPTAVRKARPSPIAIARTNPRDQVKIVAVAKPAPLVVPTADPLLEEVRLVAGARAAIEHNPKQALTILAQAQTDFPAGSLVEDREALAVFARLKIGERAVASAEAKKFLDRFPRGPYTAKMKVIADGGQPAP